MLENVKNYIFEWNINEYVHIFRQIRRIFDIRKFIKIHRCALYECERFKNLKKMIVLITQSSFTFAHIFLYLAFRYCLLYFYVMYRTKFSLHEGKPCNAAKILKNEKTNTVLNIICAQYAGICCILYFAFQYC